MNIITTILIIVVAFFVCIYFYIISRTHKEYKKKDIVLESYISITTTPSRIDKIQPVIDSFINQTLRPTSILINIPIISFRGEKYKIPEWLKEYDREGLVRIIKLSKDYGPGTKLYGALKVVDNPNAIIVIADDDIVHSKRWFENIIFFSEKDPKSACSYLKWNYKGIDVGQGYMGVAMRRGMIRDDILNFPDVSCIRGDDLWISAYLHNKNIKINRIIPRLLGPFLRFLYRPLWFTPEAKGDSDNNTYNYEKCIEYISKSS